MFNNSRIALPVFGTLLLALFATGACQSSNNNDAQDIDISSPAEVSNSNPEAIQSIQQFDLLNTLTGHDDDINSVVISSSRGVVISGSRDQTVRSWSLDTGELLDTFSAGDNEVVYSVAISPDGETVASGGSKVPVNPNDIATIKIWNLRTGELMRSIPAHGSSAEPATFSPDGQTLISIGGYKDNLIKFWNVRDGSLVNTIQDGIPISVAISPDGQTLAIGDWNNFIRVWDLNSNSPIRTLSGHSEQVRTLAFTPDGQTLISGSMDQTIKVWRLSTGELLRTLEGHEYPVSSVAISPNGNLLASGSGDDTIKIWDLNTGELIETLTGHSDTTKSVAISADGKTLVSGSIDRTIKIWNIAP